MRKIVKMSSLLLAGIMTVSSILPISAFDIIPDTNGNSKEYIEYQNTNDEDFVSSTSVFAELGSSYKVTIPKVVVLSGISK